MYKVIIWYIYIYIYIYYEMTTTIGLVNTSINSQNCHFFLLSFFLRNSTLFSTVTEQICIPANSHNGLLFSTSLPTLICLIKAILTEMRWYLFVALIWISLVIHDVETFSCICQPFVCLLWKNVYLNSLPIYKSDFFFFFAFRCMSSIYIFRY